MCRLTHEIHILEFYYISQRIKTDKPAYISKSNKINFMDSSAYTYTHRKTLPAIIDIKTKSSRSVFEWWTHGKYNYATRS